MGSSDQPGEVLVHPMKAYEGDETHSFFTSALEGTSSHFIFRGKAPATHWMRSWEDFGNGGDLLRRGKSPSPVGNPTRIPRLSSPYPNHDPAFRTRVTQILCHSE